MHTASETDQMNELKMHMKDSSSDLDGKCHVDIQNQREADITFGGTPNTTDKMDDITSDSMLRDLHTANGKLLSMQGDYKALLENYSKLKVSCDIRDKEVTDLTDQLRCCREDKLKIEKSLKTANTERNQLQTSEKDLKSQLKRFVDENRKREEETKAVENEYDSLKDKLEVLEKQIERLNDEVERLESENDRLAADADKEADRRYERRTQNMRVEHEERIVELDEKRHEEQRIATKKISFIEEQNRCLTKEINKMNQILEQYKSREASAFMNMGSEHKRVCAELKDNLKLNKMPWQPMHVTVLACLDEKQAQYAVGYREDKDAKLGIFDSANLTNYDTGFGKELIESLAGEIIDICVISKASFLSVVLEDSSQKTYSLSLYENDSLSADKKAIKTSYTTNVAKKNPHRYGKILHRYGNAIYYIESSSRIAKYYQQYGKWKSEVESSMLKDLQQIAVHQDNLYIMSKSKISQLNLNTKSEVSKDVCSEDSILTTFDCFDGYLMAASVVKDQVERKTTNTVYLYNTKDMNPTQIQAHIDITDFDHHIKEIKFVKMRGQLVAILLEGCDKPRMCFIAIVESQMIKLSSLSNIMDGEVNGLLASKDKLIVYGRSYNLSHPPDFKYMSLN